MMDSGPVRNMKSTLSNKFEKQCISLAFIVRIYHDARSPDSQIKGKVAPVHSIKANVVNGDVAPLIL